MKYWYQTPDSALTAYVRTVLVLEGFSNADPASLPIVTNGMPALLCKTDKEESQHETVQELMLYGKSTPPESWTLGTQTTIIAYFFRPFALPVIFNVAAKRVTDSPIDLGNWNPHKANALRIQLTYASTTPKKMQVLDQLLLIQLKENENNCEIIRQATDLIMYNPGTDILSELLAKLQLSERTFQRMFGKYVGVTPNQYRRICQFEQSFTQVRSKKFRKLTDVAYENGFADQSHFIRSFKEFTSITPNDYLKSGLRKDD